MGNLLHISPVLASILVILFPLCAFVLQAIRGKKDQTGVFSLIAIICSTVFSGLFVFANVWEQQAISQTYEWFTIGNKEFTIGILLNNLTVLMQFIVCIIALPVHLYSRSYMKGDPGIHRYWMYLSLFCFAMLGLTISKNLLMMYIFWELVGFASYLLIGFWFTKDAAIQANKKAFIVNRIGDLGFLIGIAIIFTQFGTLDLLELFGDQGIFHQGLDTNTTSLTAAGIAFFIGGMTKSAQFPLHVWLPDAMEGPTSVSSLIHAATMVAAGVFLLASIFPVFNATVLLIIAIVGTLTAASSAFFALGQYDIKKILAFSTVSQLGFMMVGIGMGAWDAAMFHLTTHAFFKCLLFLGAGAIIHEMAHLRDHLKLDFNPQDLRNMGGLRQYMPKTCILMCIAALALAGFPLTSGYLSKDALIISSFEWAIQHGGFYMLIPITLFAVSVLTAFYIGRLIFKTFFGQLRISTKVRLHEAPKSMLFPMLFLGVCSLFFIFSINPLTYHQAWLLEGLRVSYSYAEIHILHLILPLALSVSSLLAWWLGYRWYVKGAYPLNPNNALLKAALHQGYLNDFYHVVFVRSVIRLSQISFWFDRNIIDGTVTVFTQMTLILSRLGSWIDRFIVDGIVNAIANTTYYIGHLLRWVQNGRLQNYLGFALTIVLIGIIYLIIR